MSKYVSKIFPNTPIAQSGMKIGLLGGSFNPPHEGHRHISLVAMKRLGLDCVWWIVTPGNPLKSHDHLPPLQIRIQRCQECANHPRIKITGFEEQRRSPFTFETLRYLTTRFQETGFVWLMGADNLTNFHKWKRWHEIVAIAPIIVVDRPGYRHQAMSSRFVSCLDSAQKKESEVKKILSKPLPSWAFISGKLCPQSSTKIRNSSKSN